MHSVSTVSVSAGFRHMREMALLRTRTLFQLFIYYRLLITYTEFRAKIIKLYVGVKIGYSSYYNLLIQLQAVLGSGGSRIFQMRERKPKPHFPSFHSTAPNRGFHITITL